MTNDRGKFQAVIRRQRAAEPVRKIDPRRITLALNFNNLYGPEVDAACGVAEPTVDQWETGELTPTPDQLASLAELCGVTPRFFSAEHAPLIDFSVTICGDDGCRVTTPDFPADRYELARKPLHKETLW